MIPVPKSVDGAAKSWSNLPIQITTKEVASVYLSPREIFQIRGYGDSMFERKRIDAMPSLWPSAKGGFRNPNTTGIKGEWAVTKYFSPDITLEEFLTDRPWRLSDMGDAIIGSKDPKVFDYKTRTRAATIADMTTGLGADSYMAEMDAKFMDDPKYSYLQAFIFCVNNEANKVVHVMGWMMAKDYFALAERIPRGNPIPQCSRPYDTDELVLPYRRLKPIEEIFSCQFRPISTEVTLLMKKDWQTAGYDVKKYLSTLQVV